MTKRNNVETEQTAHDWSEEVKLATSKVRAHPNRLATLRMASYKTYLIFCHCFGFDSHENFNGSQKGISEHCLKKHGFSATGNQVHDAKHAGLCWLSRGRHRGQTNRVRGLFGDVVKSWVSRVGEGKEAGIKFLEKHQRFRQTLANALEQNNLLDKLDKYECIYRQINNQKLFLTKIVQEFVRDKEISQIIFEDNGVDLSEKEADLSLEIAAIVSGVEIQNGDVFDQAQEIVEAIKNARRGIMANNNLDFIRDQLEQLINADMGIFDDFVKKVEMWKGKSSDDLLLGKIIDKFLAGDDDYKIEFELSLPEGDGVKRLELALRLLGRNVQLQEQPCEWVNDKFEQIESLYLEQEKNDVDKINQADAKPVKAISRYYCALWTHLFNTALEKSSILMEDAIQENRAIWTGSYFECVKNWTTSKYSKTASSKDHKFRDRWQYLISQELISPVPDTQGTRRYYISDPNQFEIILVDEADSTREWLGIDDSAISTRIVIDEIGTDILSAEKSISEIKEAPIDAPNQKESLVQKLIRENKEWIISLEQEISKLSISIDAMKNEVTAMEKDQTLLKEILNSRREETKRLGIDV